MVDADRSDRDHADIHPQAEDRVFHDGPAMTISGRRGRPEAAAKSGWPISNEVWEGEGLVGRAQARVCDRPGDTVRQRRVIAIGAVPITQRASHIAHSRPSRQRKEAITLVAKPPLQPPPPFVVAAY